MRMMTKIHHQAEEDFLHLPPECEDLLLLELECDFSELEVTVEDLLQSVAVELLSEETVERDELPESPCLGFLRVSVLVRVFLGSSAGS